ncbi:D-2-hydroxyacid dehydrogenase [Zobellella maritima]|uniref:D-2-hydroxyacid dehydrogenase n=1 Tax=Zobellella maritima TaxID=2059725 RepID=UPI000E30A2E2|nr:D-2-hydroxyacid dehydrogenase [Zobellella maritima]
MTHVVVLRGPEQPLLPGLDGLEQQARVTLATDQQTLQTSLPEADILLVTDFRTELLERAWPDRPKLKWVHATSAGVDRLCFPALRDSNIVLTNARGNFERGIAEYVLGAILMFAKDTLTNLRLQQSRSWQHRETESLIGKQVLVMGAGAIGAEVARMLGAMGMRVTGVARSARVQPPFARVCAQDDLPALLPQADYVVVTAPLTPRTRGLFDRTAFRAMAPHARFINVGRGPIVVTDDLLHALQAEEIAGAALDVFDTEPLPPEHPLWTQPNVMISAHMAGDVVGWERRLGEQFMVNFTRFERGERLLNEVDKNSGFIPGGR